MAEEQSGQERTEEPTERRKLEARKKGQVPRSKELNIMLSLLITGTGLWVLGGPLIQQMFAISSAGLSFDRALAFDSEQMAVHFMYMVVSSLLALAPFLAVTVVAALAGPLLMGGWSFSLEAMAFKLDKLDPIKGLGRLFSIKGLLELVKALIKFVLLLGVTYLLIQLYEREILNLSAFSPSEASARVIMVLMMCLLTLSATLLLIVMFDVPFELWSFNKQLRMTRQEIREELKESEGRPEVRQRIRSLQREASQRRMMEAVPKADVVLTNPTHYAVALSYADRNSAPVVVAKGRDLIAGQIRRIADEHSVPIFAAPPLTRALYGSTKVGDEIPQELYLAVARVLAYLHQLKRSRPTDYVPRPTDLHVPTHFDKLNEEAGDGD